MALRISLPLLIVTALATYAHAEKKPKAGIGVGVKQSSDGIIVTQVVPHSGAKLAGIEKGDVIVSAAEFDSNGKPKQSVPIDTRESTNHLPGEACTYVNVVVKRNSRELPAKKILRIPRASRGGGDCVGYYQFKTEMQRRNQRYLRQLARDLFDSVKEHKQKDSKLEALNSDSAEDSRLTVSSFLGRVKDEYKVDMSLLEEHAKQVLEHMHESMPEGPDGKWEVIQIGLRVTDGPDERGAHVDFGDYVTVLTTLMGKPTRFHPLGCLGAIDASELRQAQASKTLVLQDGRRLDTWQIGKPKEHKRVPDAIRRLAKICKVTDDEKKKGLHPNVDYKPVPHEGPRDQRRRVVFILQVRFVPNR